MISPQAGSLEYYPCHYGSSKLLFRGPPRRLRGRYVACIGSTETFGQYIRHPYPDLLEDALGLPCINLGCRNAGIDAFLSCPSLVDIAAMAKVTVVQVMGAANMSNRFYTVDPRRNHRFIRASRKLKQLYPEIDFREFEQTAHMLTALARTGPERLQQVRHEVQTAWVARMTSLIAQIGGPVVLLWMADHAPYSRAAGGTICRDPLFIDRAMLDAAGRGTAGLIEVVASPEEVDTGFAEMVFGPLEQEAAREMLGPAAHRRAGAALADALRRQI